MHNQKPNFPNPILPPWSSEGDAGHCPARLPLSAAGDGPLSFRPKTITYCRYLEDDHIRVKFRGYSVDIVAAITLYNFIMFILPDMGSKSVKAWKGRSQTEAPLQKLKAMNQP